ncbi:MAG TPA: glycine zipper 2TM domain-containing protein [Pseudomonadales bacterium]
MRKGNALATVVMAGSLSLTAAAQTDHYGDSGSYWISAPVVNVTPITSQRTIRHPVHQCTSARPEYGYGYDHDYRPHGGHRRESYFLPGLFGGLVGGLIGNQFGGGSGKKALTVVGALAGSSIARDVARERSRANHPTEICRTSYRNEVIEDVAFYDVTYEYAGHQFNKRMSSHPGDTVRVRVELEPAVNGS